MKTVKEQPEEEKQEIDQELPTCSAGYVWDDVKKECVLDPLPIDPTHPNGN